MDQSYCWFSMWPQRGSMKLGSCSAAQPCVWLEDGRGACGKHHQELARLPIAKDEAA